MMLAAASTENNKVQQNGRRLAHDTPHLCALFMYGVRTPSLMSNCMKTCTMSTCPSERGNDNLGCLDFVICALLTDKCI